MPKESLEVHAVLLERSRQGDWPGVMAALEELWRTPPPHTSAALHDRARVLEEALTSARVIRADLAASLVRLNAASRFTGRQYSGASTKS